MDLANIILDIVIVTPIVEELLFRHLIIHELGKKLTYGAMRCISINLSLDYTY